MPAWLCVIGNLPQTAAAVRRLGFDCRAILDKRKPVAKEFLALTTLMLPANLQSDPEVDACFAVLVAQAGLPAAIISHTEHGYAHVARLSARHGLPANSVRTHSNIRDKAAMRDVFRASPALALDSHSGDADAIAEYLATRDRLNMIVKPVDGWGSRNIAHIKHPKDIEIWRREAGPAWHRWIAEAFIDGPEYSVEIVRFAGVSFLLGITEKQTTGAPYYVETGHLFPAPSTPPAMVAEILDRVTLALDLLDVRIGATHTEVRLDPIRGPLIVETHLRHGGDHIDELIEYTTGLDISELSVASVLGHPPPPPAAYTQGAAVRFFLGQDGFCAGIEASAKVDPSIVKKWEFEVTPGLGSVATTDSPTRAGCMLCLGPTATAAWAETGRLMEQTRIKYSPHEPPDRPILTGR